MKTRSKGAEGCGELPRHRTPCSVCRLFPTLMPACLARLEELGLMRPQASQLARASAYRASALCVPACSALQPMLQFDQSSGFPRPLCLIPGGHAFVFCDLHLIGIHSTSCITLHPIMRSANICWGLGPRAVVRRPRMEAHYT